MPVEGEENMGEQEEEGMTLPWFIFPSLKAKIMYICLQFIVVKTLKCVILKLDKIDFLKKQIENLGPGFQFSNSLVVVDMFVKHQEAELSEDEVGRILQGSKIKTQFKVCKFFMVFKV